MAGFASASPAPAAVTTAGGEVAVGEVAVGAVAAGEGEAVEARPFIISCSHFCPRQELLPEKRVRLLPSCSLPAVTTSSQPALRV